VQSFAAQTVVPIAAAAPPPPASRQPTIVALTAPRPGRAGWIEIYLENRTDQAIEFPISEELSSCGDDEWDIRVVAGGTVYHRAPTGPGFACRPVVVRGHTHILEPGVPYRVKTIRPVESWWIGGERDYRKWRAAFIPAGTHELIVSLRDGRMSARGTLTL
jgi:hypothetical protein